MNLGAALGRYDHLSDRPERDARELQMGPCEGDANDGDREDYRGHEVTERQPPAGEQEPDDIAEHPERAGADIARAGDLVARDRPRAERQQCVDGDIERRPRPRQADDGDSHDDGSHQPAERHPGTADENPEYVEQDGNGSHGISAFNEHAYISLKTVSAKTTPISALGHGGNWPLGPFRC